MAINKFTIIRDTRERALAGWHFEPSDVCEGTVTGTSLRTGDYTIQGMEHLLCIERKGSVAEFATNSTETRFKNELDRMVTFKHKFIICEFSLQDIFDFPIGSNIPKKQWDKLRLTSKYLIRFIAEIEVKYKISVLLCGSRSNAEQMALSIFKRVYESEHA